MPGRARPARPKRLPPGRVSLDPVSALETATRAHAGRAGNASGERFETALLRGHEKYAETFTAQIAQVGEKTRGAPGNVRRVRSGFAPDFVGAWVCPPPLRSKTVAIAFDAKGTTGKANLTMPALCPKMDPKDVRRVQKQVAWLLRFWETGGVAFYACYDAECRDDGGAVFLVSALALAPLVDDLDASIPLRSIVGRGEARRIETPHPVVYPSAPLSIASGRPLWDWSPVLAQAIDHEVPGFTG